MAAPGTLAGHRTRLTEDVMDHTDAPSPTQPPSQHKPTHSGFEHIAPILRRLLAAISRKAVKQATSKGQGCWWAA